MNDPARLFFGLQLTDDARGALSDAARGLAFSRGRLTPAENYHITLVFLGMTERTLIPRLLELARAAFFAPLTLELTGSIGTFKGGRVVWAGVRPDQGLLETHARLVTALRTAGRTDLEDEYTPHVTLGREMTLLKPPPAVRKVTFTAERVTLFESRRVDGALRYVPLGGSGR